MGSGPPSDLNHPVGILFPSMVTSMGVPWGVQFLQDGPRHILGAVGRLQDGS